MLPEEVTKLIGQAGSVKVLEVEKGAIKKFADAIDDPNPLYWDEEYARNSRYGSIIAPPGFFGWPTKPVEKSSMYLSWPTKLERESPTSSEGREELREPLTKAGYTRVLDVGMEYDFFTPVRVGDTLVASSRIKNITERTGKTGKMIFIITETTYIYQNGDLVAKARGIGVRH